MTGHRSRRSASRGVAAGGDYSFSARVAASYAVDILRGAAWPARWDLPVGVRLMALAAETDQPVDDLKLSTSEGGRVLVQIKRTVAASSGPASALADAVDRFTRQYLGVGLPQNAPAFDTSRDRLVLVCGSTSGRATADVLPAVLRRIRDLTPEDVDDPRLRNADERRVWAALLSAVRRSWSHYASSGQAPTQDQLFGLLRALWIERLEVDNGEPDEAAALGWLRHVVLADPNDDGLAWATLVERALRAATGRTDADASRLRQILTHAGLPLSDIGATNEPIGEPQGPNAATAHVFISYVREDAVAVRRLASDLKAQNVEVWLDRERLRPGVRWQAAIRQAIESGAFFVACFSRHSLAKERSYMNEELTLAIGELRKRPHNQAWFLPVLLSPGSLPYRDIGGGQTLHDIQYVELCGNWHAGLTQLLEVIKPQASTRNPQLRRLAPEIYVASDPSARPYPPEEGLILRDPDGTLWIVYDGTRFRLPDEHVRKWLFPHTQIVDSTREAVLRLPTVPPDGALLREEPSPIYVIYGGARFHVPDPGALIRLYDVARVRYLWPSAAHHLPIVPNDGTLLSEEPDFMAYEIRGGRRRPLANLKDGHAVGRLWRGALDRFSLAQE